MVAPKNANGEGGVNPKLSADDFVAALGDQLPNSSIATDTLATVGSANLTIPFLYDLSQQIIAADLDAIVLAQGTDTLEESSYLLSLLVGNAKPVILTGAMRPASSLSADGPANIRDALVLAESLANGDTSLTGGVYAVMNGEIHDPARVRKTHTAALNAFESDGGVIGRIDETQPHIDGQSRPQPLYSVKKADLAKIRLVTATLDDDPDWVPHTLDGVSGLVVEAYGAGHVSEAWSDMLEGLAKEMPVVLASRAGRGVIYQSTYAYKGAEIDLLARGLVSAGRLSGRKARLALMIALAEAAKMGGSWQTAFSQMTA